MKKAILAAILIAAPLTLFAHGGGLNGNDCHNQYDRYGNWIGYHCH